MGIVGLCGSAGGVDALSKFFEAMPVKTGLAFVVVMHLAPTRESHLAEVLGHRTSMTVQQAQDGVPLAPDHIYVIPPNAILSISQGCLKVRKPRSEEKRRRPSDSLFHSLAKQAGNRAVGIILSGSGSDGSVGLGSVKDAGGLTLVQDPSTAQHDSMPRNAIETGMVDRVLSPEEMPQFLVSYLERAQAIAENEELSETIEAHVEQICRIVRTNVGHDFGQYKRNTLLRRVHRRMLVNEMSELEQYVGLLQKSVDENQRLLRELLISVTAFFRDSTAFAALREQVVKNLLPDCGPKFRVWVPACATGEEVYSLAIMLLEIFEQHQIDSQLQIFATDIDEDALRTAREGRYPEGIADQLTPKQLQRYFTFHKDHYQVRKDLRSLCLFSRHNLTSHPPFSKLDLASCRNLLIYLQPELQSRVVRTLHYSLNAGGILFLGQSESLAGHTELFSPLDKTYRVFSALQVRTRFSPSAGESLGTPVAFDTILNARQPIGRKYSAPTHPLPSSMFKKLGLTVVVFDSRNRIVESYGSPDLFFAIRSGPLDDNLLTMAREEIRIHLRTAVHSCRKDDAACSTTIRSDLLPGSDSYELCVMPNERKSRSEPDTWLAVFQRQVTDEPDFDRIENLSSDPVVAQLESELESTREHLQTTVEELETSNEELRSSNEELLSMNEELQSSNEELETSKEELQSVNEELETVNSELQGKIQELDRAHADLWNLFESNPAPTVFLDLDMRVQQYTPRATDVFRLIPSDRGRPITDLTFLLEGVNLNRAIKRVLETSKPEEFRLKGKTDEPRFYNLKISLYRNLRQVVEGVVLGFFETTKMERTRGLAELQASRQKVLSELGASALRGAPVEELIQQSLEAIHKLLNVNLAVFLLPGKGRPGRELHWHSSVGWKGRESTPKSLQVSDYPLLKRLQNSSGPVEYAGEAEEGWSDWERKQGTEVSLGLRLAESKDPYGFLVTYGREPDKTESSKAFLGAIGNILENALIQVEESQMSTLTASVMTTLTQHRRMEDALGPLIGSFNHYFNVDIAELWKKSSDGHLECSSFRAPMDPARENQIRKEFDDTEYSLGEGLVGKAFESGTVLWSHDLENEDIFERVEEARSLGLRSGIAIPLRWSRWSSGVLTLFTSSALRETDRARQTIENLSLAMGEFTRRIKAEDTLREQEALLHKALRKAPFPLFLITDDGNIPVVSEEVSRLTGYAEEEISTIENWVSKAYGGSSEVGQGIYRLFELESTLEEGLFELRTVDGNKLLWEFYSAPLGQNPDGKRTVLAVAYDVTEKEMVRSELIAASHRKDQFLATLGHELRNPLAAITNATALLKAQGADFASSRWVKVMDRQGRQMMELLDGLLDLSRISRGKFSLNLERTELTGLTSQSVDAFRTRSEFEKLSFEFSKPEYSVWAEVDTTRWSQIIDNLLTNAGKFTPEGGLVKIRVDADEDCCRLTVTDTGCGIEATELDRVFEAFHQIDERGGAGGLGLGLALVKHLVKRHQGDISIHSDGLGEGTVVVVTVPTCQPPTEVSVEQYAPVEEESLDILLVEDEKDIAETQTAIFEQHGHRVRAATNAADAEELFRSARPDIVFCDIQIEGEQTGLDLVKTLKGLDKSVPAIAVTGFGLKNDEAACLAAGFDGHLAKPLRVEKMRDVLADFNRWKTVRDLRVLVVDDNKMILQTTKALLEPFGCVVETCESTEQALSAMVKFKPDIAFLDLRLGGESGVDLARQMRSEDFEQEYFLVALSGDEVDPEDAKLFDKVLLKPLTREKFLKYGARLVRLKLTR